MERQPAALSFVPPPYASCLWTRQSGREEQISSLFLPNHRPKVRSRGHNNLSFLLTLVYSGYWLPSCYLTLQMHLLCSYLTKCSSFNVDLVAVIFIGFSGTGKGTRY